ncbi:CRISPR-associated endonuclease Cas1 [Streptomyces californicus]
MTSPHLDPNRKMDFVFLLEARDSNPNGDPDAGGMPRTDPVSGQGLITDVALKRKIRNTVTLEAAGSIDTVMGIEGQAARTYFAAVPHLLSPVSAAVCRRSRTASGAASYRPRQRRLVLRLRLSRGLVHGALEQVGLDPYIGFLHGIRRVKPALALDVVEKSGRISPTASSSPGSTAGNCRVQPLRPLRPLPRGRPLQRSPTPAAPSCRQRRPRHVLACLQPSCATTPVPPPAVCSASAACTSSPTMSSSGRASWPASILDRVTVKGPGDATARSFSDYQVDFQDADLLAGIALTTLIGRQPRQLAAERDH